MGNCSTACQIIMDILKKYASLISSNVMGVSVARQLHRENFISTAAFLTIKSYTGIERQTEELIELLIGQHNVKAIARFFTIILEEYSVLAAMIPELSFGERYSLYLGNDIFFQVVVTDGKISVNIREMAVSRTFSFLVYLSKK